MTIVNRNKRLSRRKQEIDLTVPDGNAFVLLGIARRLAKDLGFSEEKRADIHKRMTSGDYENLIKVFDEEFGDYVDLLR
jgi:hypothetical protein